MKPIPKLPPDGTYQAGYEAGKEEERMRVVTIIKEHLGGLVYSHPWMAMAVDEVCAAIAKATQAFLFSSNNGAARNQPVVDVFWMDEPGTNGLNSHPQTYPV